MKKILVATILITLFFLIFKGEALAGYCTGGWWYGYTEVPATCSPVGCTAEGVPFPECSCDPPYCDESFTAAAENCNDFMTQAGCTTPQWPCNNGATCTWVPDPTSPPVVPTNTPVPPTSTPPPGCTRTCNYNVGPCGGSFPTGGSCAPDSKPAWQDCTCPDEIIDQVCVPAAGCVGPTSTPTPTNTPTPIPFYTIGGAVVNAWLSPIPDVPVQIYNSNRDETKTVNTDAGGIFTSPSDWARRDDGYAVRPAWNLTDPMQAPSCYVPPALTTKTNPPSTPLNNISYEFQSAGNFDCGTSCDFKYNCKNPDPITNLRPSGMVPAGSVTFTWDKPACAPYSMFRLDDLSDGHPWDGTCTGGNDLCANFLTTNSYTYNNIQAGHAYRVWVDSFNIGCWGQSVGVDVFGACGAPKTPSILSPLNNSCYKSELDMLFTIRQSDPVSLCYPHDASGEISAGVFGGPPVKTSSYGTNTDVLGSPGSTYTFTQWNPPNALSHGAYNFYGRTRNKQEVESGPAVRAFNIDRLSPDKPLAPIIRQNGDRTLTVCWNGVNDVGCGGLHTFPYWAQLSLDNIPPEFETVVPGWTNEWITGLCQTSTWKCPNNQTVYAQVQARDIFDRQSGWSLTSSYTCSSSPLSCSDATVAPSSPQRPGTALTFDANVSGAVASCSLYAKTGEYPVLDPANFKDSRSKSGKRCTIPWTPTTGANTSDLWYYILTLNGGAGQANCDSKTYCIDGLAPPKPSGEQLDCFYDNASGKYYVKYSWNPLTGDNGCGGLDTFPYWAQLSTVNTFDSVASGWTNGWITGSSQTSTPQFNAGTTVYAHVQSRDVLENQSGWTIPTIFKPINAVNCSGPTPTPPATPTPTKTPPVTPTPTNTPTPRPPDPACPDECTINNFTATDNLPTSIALNWNVSGDPRLHIHVGHHNDTGDLPYFWWNALSNPPSIGTLTEDIPTVAASKGFPLIAADPSCKTQQYTIECYYNVCNLAPGDKNHSDVPGCDRWCGDGKDVIGKTFCPILIPTSTPIPTPTNTPIPLPFQNYFCPV